MRKATFAKNLVKSIIVLATTMAGSSLCASDSLKKNNLINSLNDMGYENVAIENCKLSFTRKIVPNETNNGLFGYQRIIFLNSLEDFSKAVVRSQDINGELIFIFETRFDSDYTEEYLSSINNYISQNEGIAWPYTHPNRLNEKAIENEYSLRSQVAELDLMNRFQFFTNFGMTTAVSTSFQISYDSRNVLTNFLEALSDYARTNNCDLEN